jgi:flagellar biosynthesis/type III secretory pathway M-ring protein FliF/YscJ
LGYILLRVKLRLRYIVVFLAIPVLFVLGVYVWAHRPAQNVPVPGYAWVATTDGTSTSATSHVTAVLQNRGIPSMFDSMMVADFYVPMNEIPKARLVLAAEKLRHRHLIWSLH